MNQVDEKNLEKIQTEINPHVTYANGLVINDLDTLQGAVDVVRGFKGLNEEIDDTFDELISSAHEQHKLALEKKNNFAAPLKEADTILRDKINFYLKEVPEAVEKIKGLTVRVTKGFEVITDDEDEYLDYILQIVDLVKKKKLPAKVLMVDPKVAKGLITGGMEIPGHRETKKESVTIRK